MKAQQTAGSPRQWRAWLAVMVLAVVPFSAHSVEFDLNIGVAPRLDATFTSFLGGTVSYSDAWYSSLSLEYATEKSDETTQGDGFLSTVTTDVATFAVDFDVLGLNLLQGDWRLGVAGSAEYIQLSALEGGFYEADEGFEMVAGSRTLSVANDRTLQILLPTLDVRLRGSAGPLYLGIGGEYAPTIFVRLNQTLSTDPIYPGATDDGPITAGGDFQAEQSFSVSGEFRFTSDVFVPSLAAEYTHLPITYTAATLSGEQELQTVIRELSIDANVGFSFMNVFGFFPTFQTSLERSWVEIAGQDDATITDEWLFYLGARRLP